MNFSAEKASRKWAYGAFGRSGAAMVTVAAAWLLLGAPAEPAVAARRLRAGALGRPVRRVARHGLPARIPAPAAVPLPKPRPAEAPAAEPASPLPRQPQAPAGTGKPSEQAAPAPQPSPSPRPAGWR